MTTLKPSEVRMAREVTDSDAIKWTCIQAFAGLGNDAEKTEAARVEGSSHRVHVACTPSGGSRSVRIELPGDWEKALSEEQLVGAIQKQRALDGSS